MDNRGEEKNFYKFCHQREERILFSVNIVWFSKEAMVSFVLDVQDYLYFKLKLKRKEQFVRDQRHF